MEYFFLYATFALAYCAIGDINISFQYAYEGLQKAELIKRPYFIGYAADVLGQIEMARKNWEHAIKYFNHAISAYRQGDYRHQIARSQSHLADLLLRQGKIEDAEIPIHQALKVFQELNLEYEIKNVEKFLKKLREKYNK